MLVGMVIDTSGLFPLPDALVFKEFGEKVRQIFDIPIASSAGKGNVIELKLPVQTEKINHIIIRENIACGETVREYNIESWDSDHWEKVCEGISIGHKRIHKIDDLKTTKLRLNILKSVGSPQITEFSVFSATNKN
jgi:alpha-L-fucosidase